MTIAVPKHADLRGGLSAFDWVEMNHDSVTPARERSLPMLCCQSPLIDRLYREMAVPGKNGESEPMNVYIPREEGDFLYSLVRGLRPQVTVEVGMANGLSTLFITSALADNGNDGRHIAIDPYQHTDWHDTGMRLVEEAGLSAYVRLLTESSHQALPRLEAEGVAAGLVFIDGAHVFDYVMTDFLCADRLLNVGGVLVFDDSDWPAINSVIRYVVANRHYRVRHPEIVIEPPPGRPHLLSRILRKTGGAFPEIGRRLAPDFLHPDESLGILGRCVVLEKLANDDRNSQDLEAHRRF